MATKKRNSKKSVPSYELLQGTAESTTQSSAQNKPASKATILGLSPRKVGTAVAAAVIGEVAQAALKKVSHSETETPETVVQSQAGPLSDSVKDSVKNIIESVRDDLVQVVAPGEHAVERVKDSFENGRSAAVDTVSGVVKTVQATAENARDAAYGAVNRTERAKDTTQQVVTAGIRNAIDGVQGSSDSARQIIEDTVDGVQDTTQATQQAIAAVIEAAVEQIQAILADPHASLKVDKKVKGNKKKGKQGKKHKKNKK